MRLFHLGLCVILAVEGWGAARWLNKAVADSHLLLSCRTLFSRHFQRSMHIEQVKQTCNQCCRGRSTSIAVLAAVNLTIHVTPSLRRSTFAVKKELQAAMCKEYDNFDNWTCFVIKTSQWDEVDQQSICTFCGTGNVSTVHFLCDCNNVLSVRREICLRLYSSSIQRK